VAKFAPWSVFALVGSVNGLRSVGAARPARLLSVLLVTGLGVLSLSRGQRWVYVMPLLPVAACLAAATLEGSPGLQALFRRALGVAAAGAAVLGVHALQRSSRLPPELTPAGPWWAAVLFAATTLGAAALGADRLRRTGLAFALAVAALLAVNLGYT